MVVFVNNKLLVTSANFTCPLDTVGSRYCGHPRGEDLVSVIARVRNSVGMTEKNCFVFKHMK